MRRVFVVVFAGALGATATGSAQSSAPSSAAGSSVPTSRSAPRTQSAPPRRATGGARVREYTQVFPTYPFSDPNPIPVVGRIYPYFRFDGFSATPVQKAWKIVELENEYLRVLITPEIGGKIWAAIEKKSGRPFIYYNHAVKFRDIAMRGPWTSGGIEANYGIIGHTPNVSTPVDYATRTNADGSVSVITGALDLLTNTTWRVETRLAPGQASFTTTSTWYNGSSLEEPYYHWMTAGIPVNGKLQYVFPGSAQIGHDGERGEWPVNTKRNRDISWYDNNDFGGAKSYHVIGGEGDFFGVYWHNLDFGMARVAPRDEKPGEKIWIWGLSRQGMIWEDLLTETDGQYSELQSGRLFNQSAEGSTLSPFKHRGFPPHVVDRWTERWMPVVGTKGFVTASAAGALNVRRRGDWLMLALSPAAAIRDSLVVFTQDGQKYSRFIGRAPLQTWADSVWCPGTSCSGLRVALGDHRLDWSADTSEQSLGRPVQAPASFDWSSTYGLWLRGKELMRQREYLRAVPLLDSALAKDAHYVPALDDRASLCLRSRQYPEALALTKRALAVDAYDGAANYLYGLANRQLWSPADARDGFEIAAQSAEYRQAAWTELAKLWLDQGDVTRALHYADAALSADAGNLTALEVRVVGARRHADPSAHRAAIDALERADPLSHFAHFERLLAAKSPHPGATLLASVRAELPEEQLFAVASFYQDVGDVVAAEQVLEGLGENPQALYWRAALHTKFTKTGTVGSDTTAAFLNRANRQPTRFVFPWRPEVIAGIEHSARLTTAWQPDYYVALAYWFAGRMDLATTMFEGVDNRPDFAPFYAARAALPGRTPRQQVADLQRAVALDSTEWRYGKLLAERQLSAGDTVGAVATARRYYARMPASYILGLTLVRLQVAAGLFADADRVLEQLHVLPYEGAGEGRALYRETKLSLAVDAIGAHRLDDAKRYVAQAREWPERLGVGKPYDADIDDRLENWLLAEIAREIGAPEAAAQLQSHPMPPADGLEGRVIARWRAQAR